MYRPPVGCVGWRRRALERYPLITRVRYRAKNSSSPSVDERNRVVDAAYFKIVRTDPDKPDCPSLTNCRSRVRCLATRGLALDCGRRGSRHLRWRLERLGFGSLSQWVWRYSTCPVCAVVSMARRNTSSKLPRGAFKGRSPAPIQTEHHRAQPDGSVR